MIALAYHYLTLPTIPPVSHRTLQLDVLLMVLFTHCYRDSLCVSATSMRPVCDLHDCSQIKMPFGNRTPFLIQDMVDWWFGLLSYACVFTHLSA